MTDVILFVFCDIHASLCSESWKYLLFSYIKENLLGDSSSLQNVNTAYGIHFHTHNPVKSNIVIMQKR